MFVINVGNDVHSLGCFSKVLVCYLGGMEEEGVDEEVLFEEDNNWSFMVKGLGDDWWWSSGCNWMLGW